MPRRRPRDRSAGKNPRDPARVSHWQAATQAVRHPSGVVYLSGSSFPGSSALRASTPGLKSDDPSGASPLRDRQAVAAGRGSVLGIAQYAIPGKSTQLIEYY